MINLEELSKEVDKLIDNPLFIEDFIEVTSINDWNSLQKQPPDKLVEVMDKEGNIGKAYPTYYPFKVVPNPNKIGKWTRVPCEPYWDGGWMIYCEGLTSNINEIIAWRNVKELEESYN